MKKILLSLLFSVVVHADNNTSTPSAQAQPAPAATKNAPPAVDCSKSASLACKPKNVRSTLESKVKSQEDKYDKALKDIGD